MTDNEYWPARTALVTGAATGLGNAIATALLERGARVAVTHRPDGHHAGITELVERFGRAQVLPFGCDLADGQAVVDTFAAALAELGGVDLLVNNAGVWPTATVAEMSAEDWDRTFAINARAPFLLCREFIRQEKSAGEVRKVLNVTSQAAFHGSTTGHAHYAASKAALVTFTRSLAREVAGEGVTANCMAIGMMESNMTQASIAARHDYYVGRIPLGRIAEPEDLIPTALFLLSPGSNYITGATFDVTGGMLMR